MQKKKVANPESKAEEISGIHTKKPSDSIISLLVDNFISLQKNLTTLTERFNELSNQISSLLRLFEISAKSIAEKPELGFEREFLDKLNALLEQNKVIAKALAIIEERTRHQPTSMPLTPIPQPYRIEPARQAAPITAARPVEIPKPVVMTQAPSEEYIASSMERKPKPLPST